MKAKTPHAAVLGCALTAFAAASASAPLPVSKATPIAASIAQLKADRVIADYGSYTLLRGSDGQKYAMGQEGLTAVTGTDRLELNRASFDTRAGEPQVPAQLSAAGGDGPGLHLVQFAGPIRQDWLDALKADGVQPVHYLPTNGYLVWTDEAGRERLEAQARSSSMLQYAGDYHPFYKLDDALSEPYGKSPRPIGNDEIEITIQVYKHAGTSRTQSDIRALANDQTVEWYDVLNYRNARFVVRESDIPQLAALSDVVWIERYVEPVRLDEVQNQILRGALTPDGAAPTGIGYLPWLASRGFSTTPADYPIVDVTDDGVDDMDTTPADPTLWPNGVIGATSRVLAAVNCTGSGTGGAVEGHGHINANIVGGYDVRTNAQTAGARFPITDVASGLGYQRGLGVNPFARLANTRIFGGPFSLTNCGGNEVGLIRQNQLNGAAISSNSWGAPVGGAYNSASQVYDAGTRDANASLAGHQQMLFVISAGNSGPSANTTGSPGTAKNALTVGASENWRPTDENGNWTDGCNVGPTGADSAMDTIDFSSRGPTDDQRTKPEITAPGTHITGTQSPSGVGGGTCDDERPAGNATYAASSGTSHSAPAVSGVASLAYWWLQNNPESNILFAGGGAGITPSPAAMKAYLLAHPTPLTGVSNGGNLPSQAQGYGMPNLDLMFDNTNKFVLDQSHVFDNSGDPNYTWDGAVADAQKPVRVVLTWTDAPGALSGNAYVNNLDLEVEADGVVYRGNVFNGNVSTAGGVADVRNNYEAVFLPPGAGAISVRVIPTNIAGDGIPGAGDATDQDFALVISNGVQEPTFSLNAEPELREICTLDDSSTDYSIAVGSILGFTAPVSLSVSGVPSGATSSFDTSTVTPPAAAALSVSSLDEVDFGTYTLSVSGTSGGTSRSDDVSLRLFTAVAAAPELTTPADDATDVPVAGAFAWTATEQASEYLLEVATDAAFTDIIRSQLVSGTTANFVGNELPSNSVLFWRVSSANVCGAETSSVRSFSTQALPGDCPIGAEANEIAADDLEGSVAGWASSGTGNTWAISSVRSHSPTKAYHAADPATASDQRLVSPAYTLPADQAPLTLSFWHNFNMETSTSGCWDAGILEVSTNAGSTWTQIPGASLLTSPYTGTIGTGNPLVGLTGWCGVRDWGRAVVDLAAYAGQTVQFRYRLGSDASVSREGWYVDDLRVQSCAAVDTSAIFSNGFEGN